MSLRSLVAVAKILWQEFDWQFYWPIICKFGVSPPPREMPGSELATCSVDVPHFSGLYFVGLTLSRENYERLTTGALFDCPAICCGCGQPTNDRLAVSPQRERGAQIRLSIPDVPVCESCRSKQRDRTAPLIVTPKGEGGKLLSLLLISRSSVFLNETARRNDAGELLPPWFWRPDDDIQYMRYAFSLHHRWWKMFREFTAAEREEYLKSWPASDAWQAWLQLSTR